MELTKKQTLPFDIYDFFGYLFPGFVMFVYLSIFIYLVYYNQFVSFNLEPVKSMFLYGKYEIFFTILFLILFTMSIYVIGHFVATLGSFWLDRIFLYGTFDSPIYYLLNLENNNRSIYLEFTYRYLFVLFYLFNVISIFSSYYLFLNIALLILTVIIGIFFLRLFYEWEFFRNCYNKLKDLKLIDLFVNGFIGKFIKVLFDLLRILVNNNKQLPKELVESYETEFKSRFYKDYQNIGDDSLWLSYFFISSKNLEHTSNIRTWHQLYGFSRNIACSSFISTLLCSLYLLKYNFEKYYLSSINVDNNNLIYIIYLLIFSLIIGTIFYFRYFNLNQSYYTKNIIRSFITLSLNPETK